MTKPKGTIMLLHPGYDLYGASRVLLQVAVIMKENGYRPFVILSNDGPLKTAFEQEGVQVYLKPLAVLRRKYFNIPGLTNRLKAYRKSKSELSQLVIEHKVDIIYSNTAAIMIGSVIAKRFNLRHIWHIHEIIESPVLLNKFIGLLAKRSKSELVTVSNAVSNHWKKYVSNFKIRRIYNGFDFSYLDESQTEELPKSLEDDRLVIGMIARVHFWKGQTYFLEIAAALQDLGLNAKFVMVGDAFPGYEYLYQEIDQKIKALGLEGDVIKLGFRNDIGQILDHLDLFVLPSILPDPLPTTVLEAMSRKIVVAATAHGGATEMVVEGETGTLIPWDNAKQAAQKISQLVKNKDFTQFGENGRRRVETSFSQEVFKTNIINLLDSNEE